MLAFVETEESVKKTIWRYFTLPKFLATLTSKSLWFSRATEFQDDHFEAFCNPQVSEFGPDAERWQQAKEWLSKGTAEAFRSAPQRLYINCWYVGDCETSLMWGRYASQDDGIAIRSDDVRLKAQLLEGGVPQEDFDCGTVTYVRQADFNKTMLRDFRGPVPAGRRMIAEVLRVGFFKRDLYSLENEWRAIIYQDPRPERGLDVKVDLNALIEEIVVAPRAPDFLMEALKILLKGFQVNAPIRRSDLLRQP